MPCQGFSGMHLPSQPRIRSERGSVLVMIALSTTMLLTLVAFSMSASYAYDKRNMLYAAADAAAKSAAAERHRGITSSTALQAFADSAVTAHGLTAVACGTTTVGSSAVCVTTPPSSGAFAGNANYVQVTVSQPTPTFFGSLLSIASLTPSATAIAGTSSPVNCMVLTQNLTIGNTELAMSGCGVGVGGNLSGTNPNAEISGTPTPAVQVTGTCSGTCGHMGTLSTGTAAPSDPLALLPAYTSPSGTNCPGGAAGTTATLTPGCYTSISTAVSTLSAGNYYVTGPININNLTANGVFIYLTGSGALQASNNKSFTISAPTAGTYAGIAIFQDRGSSTVWSTGNSFALSLTGAIYAPGADVSFPNGLDLTNTGCALFYARSLSIGNGNGAFSSTGCAGAFSTAAFLSVSLAE